MAAGILVVSEMQRGQQVVAIPQGLEFEGFRVFSSGLPGIPKYSATVLITKWKAGCNVWLPPHYCGGLGTRTITLPKGNQDPPFPGPPQWAGPACWLIPAVAGSDNTNTQSFIITQLQ